MKQEEKNQLSRERILRAATKEFGEKGYDGTSMNMLLAGNGLSKGLVYHYFENKDQLYLSCVKECFASLIKVLSAVETDASAEEILQAYFAVRGQFFQEHPDLSNIFLGTLIQPPPHLQKEITKIQLDFEKFNRALFCVVLNRIHLREGISQIDALKFFSLIQSAFQLQFFSMGCVDKDDNFSLHYEEKVREMLSLLLYGLAGRAEQ